MDVSCNDEIYDFKDNFWVGITNTVKSDCFDRVDCTSVLCRTN